MRKEEDMDPWKAGGGGGVVIPFHCHALIVVIANNLATLITK